MGLFSEIGDAFGDVAGFVLDPFDIVDTGGIKRAVGDITGRNAEDALNQQAQQQSAALQQIIDLIRPTIEFGQAQQEPIAQSATLEGFGRSIGDILTGGAIDPLIDERQRRSQAALAGAGLRRSGAAAREAANIPTDLAFQIESELNRRRQSIAQQGQTGIGQTAGLTGQIGNILNTATQQGLGARAAGTQNILGFLAGGLGALSDVALKDNVTKIGEIGDLGHYEWEWNEKALQFGLSGKSSGVLAQEVEEKYPQHVIRSGSYLTVNYEDLLKEVKGG